MIRDLEGILSFIKDDELLPRYPQTTDQYEAFMDAYRRLCYERSLVYQLKTGLVGKQMKAIFEAMSEEEQKTLVDYTNVRLGMAPNNPIHAPRDTNELIAIKEEELRIWKSKFTLMLGGCIMLVVLVGTLCVVYNVMDTADSELAMHMLSNITELAKIIIGAGTSK